MMSPKVFASFLIISDTTFEINHCVPILNVRTSHSVPFNETNRGLSFNISAKRACESNDGWSSVGLDSLYAFSLLTAVITFSLFRSVSFNFVLSYIIFSIHTS